MIELQCAEPWPGNPELRCWLSAGHTIPFHQTGSEEDDGLVIEEWSDDDKDGQPS